MTIALYIGCFLWLIKTIIPLCVALVAFITLLLGIVEYREQGKQKKAEYFFELRKRFKENEAFKKIRNNTINNKEENSIKPQEMMDYLGFFEELQIMINSGLLKKETAYYMFGIYAIRCVDENGTIRYSDYKMDDKLVSVFKLFYDDSKKWLSDRNSNPTQIVI